MDWITSECISNLSGVVHGFLDKRFNYKLSDLAGSVGLSRIITCKQVHGNGVSVIKDGGEEYLLNQADSIIAAQNGIGIGVYTADCVPIIFIDKVSSVIAVAHAGWKGTLFEISKNTLNEMRENFGTLPSEVVAVIGPSIGGCCYEVRDDVASLFLNKFESSFKFLSRKNNSKYLLDLKKANNVLLSDYGVIDIEMLDFCTMCGEDFYSYRREGKGTGKQLSFIGLL